MTDLYVFDSELKLHKHSTVPYSTPRPRTEQVSVDNLLGLVYHFDALRHVSEEVAEDIRAKARTHEDLSKASTEDGRADAFRHVVEELRNIVLSDDD